MLKVVGASWSQIRLSWWLLAGVAVLGLIAVYCGGRPKAVADGNYAATVSWNALSGFRCEYFGQNNAPDSIKKGVARAFYQSKMADSGFAVLEIETQKEYPDSVQAYAAGFLEGSLTWQLIYWHWQNTVQKTCTDREEYCQKIRTALDENTDFIRQKASKNHKTDPFWHQVKLFYDQLDGLMYGWLAGVSRSRNRQAEELTFTDFLWINIASDLRDLEKKFNSSRDFNPSKPSLALAFVKLLPNDFSKFVLGHSSAGLYSGMLRVQKKYTFGYHKTGSAGSHLTSGQVLLFSSYPGSLHSQDDLYLIVSDKGRKSFVVGTAIQNYNTSLWEKTDLSNQILVGPRILAANRLAIDGETWSKLATREHSGSGNKQWLYLRPEKDEVRVWVTEMLPGISVSRDMTQQVRERGFWISSNRPYFQEIQTISEGFELFVNNSTDADQHNGSIPIIQTHHNPAVNTFLEGQANVSGLASLMVLMKHPDLSIVGRSDLFGVRDAILFYSLLKPSQDELKPDKSEKISFLIETKESTRTDATSAQKQSFNSVSNSENNTVDSQMKTNSDNVSETGSEYKNPRSPQNESSLQRKEVVSTLAPSKLEVKVRSKNISSNELLGEKVHPIEEESVENPTKEMSANIETEKTLQELISADFSTSESTDVDGGKEDGEEVIKISNDNDGDDDNSNDNDGRYQPEKSMEVDLSVQVPGRFSFIVGLVKARPNDVQLNVDYSGLIDMKVISSDFDLRVAAGPPFSFREPGRVIEPFQWSKSFIKDSPHVGHVDTWNYDFVQPNWAWPLNFTLTFAP